MASLSAQLEPLAALAEVDRLEQLVENYRRATGLEADDVAVVAALEQVRPDIVRDRADVIRKLWRILIDRVEGVTHARHP